jgi:competence protein ComEC
MDVRERSVSSARLTSMLKVWFLNVGHGDCTVIQHPSGRLTMVDINASRSYDSDSLTDAKRAYYATQPTQPGGGGLQLGALSWIDRLLADLAADEAANKELTDPIEFVKHTFKGQSIWRFILTHPDMDHMSGLKRLNDEVGFDNFWDTSNTKPTPVFRGEPDEEEWEFYQDLRAGKHTTNVRNFTRGANQYAFGVGVTLLDDWDNIEVLSPSPDLVTSCNVAQKSNDLSIVLRISHGGTSIILPGDAEEEAWSEMLGHFGVGLKCNILKASHHGRDSGYHLASLKAMSPRDVVVSVGRKPATDASAKYKAQCEQVISTRYYGNLRLEVHDNGAYQWFPDRMG